MAGGRYGGLRDEVPRGDVEWDVGRGEDLDLDLEEFDISPPRGVRREAAERSRRRRDEEAYMEGVRREHLGVKPVRTPVAILGSLGVCIYVPASRHWLISYSPIHLT